MEGTTGNLESSLKIGKQIRRANDKANDEKCNDVTSEKVSSKLVISKKKDSIPSSSNSQVLLTNSKFMLPQSVFDPCPSDEAAQMSNLSRMPDCCLPLPKLEPSEHHSVMFSPDIQPGEAPYPYPETYTDKWDSDHVRMPCSPLNKYAEKNSHGENVFENGWDVICQSLRSTIKSSEELEEAIMKYNSRSIGKWNFVILHTLINHHFNDEERENFFKTILPAMIDMALDLPKICTQPVPLLKTGKDHSITLSQKQIGCLLLNAFFCTFPQRNHQSNKKRVKNSEYVTYPEINFNKLFAGHKGEERYQGRKINKLKCLINYFKRIIAKEPTGTVTFHRQVIPDPQFPNWHGSSREIRSAVIRSSGLIETDGTGMLQVDFADKSVGGRFLGTGCVQEEIRFAISPELLVSCLFVEHFHDNEALIVTGVEQYNKYSGYADTFKWEGDFRDEVSRDSWGRKYTQLVAMDATFFKNPRVQFESPYIKRELNKAYCGFYENGTPAHLPAVATGNWGCGVFKGNPNLKFLIQLMAASEAGRSLVYFTCGNKKLKTELQTLFNSLNDKTVGDCWQFLMSYSDNEKKAVTCDS